MNASNGFKPNTVYHVKMMVKGQQSVSCQVRAQGSFGGNVYQTEYISGGPKWSPYEFSFNTGDRDMTVLTWTNDSTAAGHLYFDNIELYEEGSSVNLIDNPGFELDPATGTRPKWGSGNAVFRFVEGEPATVIEILSGASSAEKLTANTDYTVVAHTENAEPSSSYTLIVALYQDNVLREINIDGSGRATLKCSMPTDAVDSRTEFRAMLLDSFSGMAALCGKTVLTAQGLTQ
jgi:hypothetical protein